MSQAKVFPILTIGFALVSSFLVTSGFLNDRVTLSILSVIACAVIALLSIALLVLISQNVGREKVNQQLQRQIDEYKEREEELNKKGRAEQPSSKHDQVTVGDFRLVVTWWHAGAEFELFKSPPHAEYLGGPWRFDRPMTNKSWDSLFSNMLSSTGDSRAAFNIERLAREKWEESI